MDLTWLDQATADIYGYIKTHGLNSLHWVSGTDAPSLAPVVLEILADMPIQPATPVDQRGDFHALLVPEEKHLNKGLLRETGCSLRCLGEDCTDSFLVINRNAVLDVTEYSFEDPLPKLNSEPTVVSLFMVLFSILENRVKID